MKFAPESSVSCSTAQTLRSIAGTAYFAMMPTSITRCAIGAALICAWSSSAWPAGVLRAPGGGSVRAVLIGIDKYPNLDKASELNGAVADAENLTGALAKVGVPAANI